MSPAIRSIESGCELGTRHTAQNHSAVPRGSKSRERALLGTQWTGLWNHGGTAPSDSTGCRVAEAVDCLDMGTENQEDVAWLP